MINQAITTNRLNDSKQIPRVQVEFLGKTLDNVVLMQPKGFHTIPPKGTACLVVEVSENQHFAFMFENINRPKDLEDTESVVGCYEAECMIKFRKDGKIELINPNSSIILKSDGEINITADGSSIDLKTDSSVVINSGSNHGVQYEAMNTFIQSMVGLINTELGKIDTAVPAYTKTDIVVNTVPSKLTNLKVE